MVSMRWVTRKNGNVDRVACPWLIKRFIDPDAQFIFVPGDTDPNGITDGIPFDMKNVELGHVDGRCSFESIMLKYNMNDPALQLMARIVHGADVPADLSICPVEAYGLKAVAFGFALLHGDNDHLKIELQTSMYDALYTWCQKQVQS
jgi:hypothetical protein